LGQKPKIEIIEGIWYMILGIRHRILCVIDQKRE